MQILIFSLIIIAIIVYVIYKIKTSFSKKELTSIAIIFLLIIGGTIYYKQKNTISLPEAFKQMYFKTTKIVIAKLSINQTNFEIVSSDKSVNTFVYIIKKNDIEYVCEAKDIKTQLIEDEYIFTNFKEECRLK
jgi:hypothetical protein